MSVFVVDQVGRSDLGVEEGAAWSEWTKWTKWVQFLSYWIPTITQFVFGGLVPQPIACQLGSPTFLWTYRASPKKLLLEHKNPSQN